MDILKRVGQIKNSGGRCVLVTVVEKKGEGPATVGKKMLVQADNPPEGTVGGGALEYRAVETARELLSEGESQLRSYVLDEGAILENTETLPMACGGKVTLFFEIISGGIPVYIYGGGHVGAALSRQLKPLGYYVHVIDDRKDIVQAMDFGDRRYCSDFYDFAARQELTPDSFVLICTPSHKNDYSVIKGLLEKGPLPRYVGLLASKKKKGALLHQISKDFGNDIDLSPLYCPVGLDTGGGTPEEIALSIAGEMQCLKYNKKNLCHMRDR